MPTVLVPVPHGGPAAHKLLKGNKAWSPGADAAVAQGLRPRATGVEKAGAPRSPEELGAGVGVQSLHLALGLSWTLIP